MSLRLAVARWRAADVDNRRLVAEATVLLAVSRLAVLVLPLRRITRHLGEVRAETPADSVSPAQAAIAERVGWSVRAASRHTPWKTPCLAEAMTAQRMMRRRRIPSTLYLGVTKSGDELGAHAWVRAGRRVLTGETSMRGHKPVASFAQAPRVGRGV